MPRSAVNLALLAALAVGLTGCGTTLATTGVTPVAELAPTIVTSEPAAPVADEADAIAPSDAADEPILAAHEYRLAGAEMNTAGILYAQSATVSAEAADAIDEEYDPWEPFNERMFEFNRRLDRYILKPVAKGYNVVVPDRVQVMISNAFDNIHFVPRLVNSVLQGKLDGAVREFGRFLFNSTVGIGGLFDVAKIEGIQKSSEDFGQTLGVWGFGPGAYLVLPFMEPLTVRDGIGKGVDGAMDPMSYFVPFIWERLGMKIEETVNDRSLNLELFQGFEESVIDMYSAVRNGYLKRREKLISE